MGVGRDDQMGFASLHPSYEFGQVDRILYWRWQFFDPYALVGVPEIMTILDTSPEMSAI